MPKWTTLLLIILALPALMSGQQRADGSAPFLTIRGQVVADDPGASPLRRVRVVVSASNVVSSPAYTDEQGRYELTVPASALYSVAFTKAGFAPHSAQGRGAILDQEQPLKLARGAAITGRVVDQFGDPLLVRARIRRIADAAGRSLTPNEWTIDGDDLGEFRVGSLPAGRFEVVVEPNNPALPPPRPGGGSTVAGRRAPTVIELGAGEESTLSFIEEADAMDPRGSVIGGSRTPVVDKGATIRGRIVGPDSRPVGGAFIRLFAGVESARQTTSAADGTYEFTGLPAGTYRINAGKIGASLSMVGGNREVAVRPGQSLEDATISLQKPSAVAGAVLDQYGDPVEGVNVELLQPTREGGRILLQRPPDVRPRRTDDRGRYRLFSARPGEHYLVARDEAAAVGGTQGSDTSMRVYYPGTSAIAEAGSVRVVAGRDTIGANITYAPTEGARVYGYAFDAAGEPLKTAVTMTESFRSGAALIARRTAVVRQDGGFTFVNVPPGDYVIQGVFRPIPGRSSEFGVAHVTVAGGDIPPVTVRTSRGTTVNGRVVLEGDTSKTELDLFGVSLSPADFDYDPVGLDLSGAGINDDGTFQLRAYGPMRVTSSVAPQGWWLKSATIGVIDAAEQPYTFSGGGDPVDLVALFSDGTAEISGRVSDAQGQPAAGWTVLVFPVDRSRWNFAARYIKIARPTDGPDDPRRSTDGRFRIPTVPPGDYWIVAVDRWDVRTDWQDVEVAASLTPLAERITVREHEKAARDLRLIVRR